MSSGEKREQPEVKKPLRGKVAVVTGAGAGIGRAIARRLSVLGARTYVNDIDGEAARTVAQEITDEGAQAIAHVGDMSLDHEVIDLFEKVEEEDGLLDILVTQAGIVSNPETLKLPEELTQDEWSEMLREDVGLAASCFLHPDDFDNMLRHNLKNSFCCCHHAIPLMKKAGGGFIVTMSSIGGGISAHAFSPSYGLAKGAIIGLTRSLARQLHKHNIVVNCISQGFTDAGIWNSVPVSHPEIWNRDWEVEGTGEKRTVHAKASNTLPLTRLCRPAEVAALVAFLVSGEGSYFVGQNFNLSGGVLIP